MTQTLKNGSQAMWISKGPVYLLGINDIPVGTATHIGLWNGYGENWGVKDMTGNVVGTASSLEKAIDLLRQGFETE
jgi:hypothetical protein